MAICDILELGNPKLYEVSSEVTYDEIASIQQDIQNLKDTFFDFRKNNGFGRAIAAPQIGFMKRIVFMHIDESITMINPKIHNESSETIELWDDCMSFPGLLVKVERYKKCQITYRDLSWQMHTLKLEGGLSELLQHECDHLDGVLAVMRVIDEKSFAFTSQKCFLDI